jgi:hypothetical protein
VRIDCSYAFFSYLSAAPAGLKYAARVERVLAQTPLIDGHNDLPWELRNRFKGNLSSIDLKTDTSIISTPAGSLPLMTDIPRLRAGHVGTSRSSGILRPFRRRSNKSIS